MVPEDCRLEWREWGAFHVVFNPASGDTHLLNALAAFVLTTLERKAATLEELERLVSDSGAPAGDVEALVRELDELGLVAPAPP
jgi:PqqD family protein of HPr-rel-A system